MTDTTAEYYSHLINTGRSTAAESYRFSLQRFSRWLKERGKDDIEDFTFNEVELYMRTGFGSPRTGNNFKIALSGYLKHKSSSVSSDSPEYDSLRRRIEQLRGIKNLKIPRVYGKSSLDHEEVKEFLIALKTSGAPQLVYSLAVMLIFWGCRPIEIEKNLKHPKTQINWEERSMLLLGAKTFQLRFLTWPPSLDAHVKIIYENCPCSYPGEYATKNFKYYMKKFPFKVTSKTFRRTFQTQNRLNGVPDILIDAILGHENSGSKMGNLYTDYSAKSFTDKINEVLTTDQHYAIKYHVIPEGFRI